MAGMYKSFEVHHSPFRSCTRMQTFALVQVLQVSKLFLAQSITSSVGIFNCQRFFSHLPTLSPRISSLDPRDAHFRRLSAGRICQIVTDDPVRTS